MDKINVVEISRFIIFGISSRFVSFVREIGEMVASRSHLTRIFNFQSAFCLLAEKPSAHLGTPEKFNLAERLFYKTENYVRRLEIAT